MPEYKFIYYLKGRHTRKHYRDFLSYLNVWNSLMKYYTFFLKHPVYEIFLVIKIILLQRFFYHNLKFRICYENIILFFWNKKNLFFFKENFGFFLILGVLYYIILFYRLFIIFCIIGKSAGKIYLSEIPVYEFFLNKIVSLKLGVVRGNIIETFRLILRIRCVNIVHMFRDTLHVKILKD